MGSIADTPASAKRPQKLQLILPARSENVTLIRHALAGLAEEIGMDEVGLADLKTVVTEACMNVVLHAYRNGPGPLSVEAEADEAGLTVVVRDEGVGIRPQVDSDRESLRLGLSLIAAFSSSFAISGGVGRGTEVTMRVPLRGGGAEHRDPVEVKPGADVRTELTVDRSELLGPVLSRIVGALAARRDLSVDRISDATLLTDAIAAAASTGFSDGRVRLGVDDDDDGIDLRLGPMEAGAGKRIRKELRVPDIGGSLEKLADSLAVEEGGDGEYLVIRFASAR